MAVLLADEFGWLICHKTFLNDAYKHCVEENSSAYGLEVNPVLFDIKTPMLMDSAAAKISNSCLVNQKSRVRKRKKKITVCDSYHMQVKDIIENAVNNFVVKGRSIGHLEENIVSPEEWLANNLPARESAKKLLSSDNKFSPKNDSSTFFIHSQIEDTVSISTFENDKYVLPPHSTFIFSDIKHVHEAVPDTQYDLVLIDPPWKNKSIKRKKTYWTMECNELLDIPIPKLCKNGALVVIWATNNEKQLHFIKNKLSERWNVCHQADWHWVKITTKGALIYPLDSDQKKPYENIIISRYGNYSEETLSLDNHKVIVSIPSSIHSHKPPLTDILKNYLPQNPKCLELFARYLLPGWTSCGNEVLLLQNLEMFQKVTSCSDVSVHQH